MKVQDIMIGNYVRVKGDSEHKPFTVGGIKKDGNLWLVYLEEAETWYKLKTLQPIGLTADILVDNNFGGEYHDDTYNGEIELSLDFDTWPAEEIEEDENGWGRAYSVSGYGTEIRYVHQLQNALNNCGKTHEIKL